MRHSVHRVRVEELSCDGDGFDLDITGIRRRAFDAVFVVLSTHRNERGQSMIGDWFKVSEAIEFGRALARDINQLFPPGGSEKARRSAKKDRRKLDSLVRRTNAFAQSHRLNVYKKAKLLNTIKWELRDSGHEESLIDEVIALLTPLLTNPKR